MMKSFTAPFCILCFAQTGICAGLNQADVLSVQKIDLKYIANDMNGEIMAYIFSASNGVWMELQPESDAQLYVKIGDDYDLSKCWSVQCPYKSATFYRGGKGNKTYQHLCIMLRELLATMRPDDQRLPFLRYLADRVEGKPLPENGGRVSGFGIKFEQSPSFHS